MDSLNFKDIIHNDIKQTFLNLGEFGETHDVNGSPMTILFDDIEHVEREKKMKSTMDGIYTRQYFMYVSADDFGPMPAQGKLVSVDGKRYAVVDATDESGIYGITLEANRSR